MSSQIIQIHRTNQNSNTSTNKKDDTWFNAFNFSNGEDSNIRWLSRPNQQLTQGKYSYDTEKFRITFDVENFKSDQIKIYIQNRRLTISGVYEEHSEGRFVQKQFERTFDLPFNADVDAMASFITPCHMLVVEIPLNASAHVDHLSIDNNANNANNQRRVSFSLNKFNTSNNQDSLLSSNNQGSLLSSNDQSKLSATGQAVRRTSITKTTTTTTSGSSSLSPEATELLRTADATTGNTTQTYSTHTTERRSSNTGNQLVAKELTTSPSSSSSTTSNKQTTLINSELSSLPIEIPSELLATGGTITIQRRKVSVTKGTDGSTDYGVSAPLTHSTNNASSTSTTSTHSTNQTGNVPITRTNNTESTLSTTTNTNQNTHQTGVVPITRNNDTQSTTSSNTLNQQQTNISQRRGSQTISTSNQNQMYTLEEFLQNKTWNPSLIDGPNGKKILHMRLQMKPGTTSDQLKVSLNARDLRVEVDNKVSSDYSRQTSERSYRQLTLFSTCDVDQLQTEFKDDGHLHIKVPIAL